MRLVFRHIHTMLGNWLPVILAYGCGAALLALGIYALFRKGHSSHTVGVIIKVLGVAMLILGLWQLIATTATLAGGPGRP